MHPISDHKSSMTAADPNVIREAWLDASTKLRYADPYTRIARMEEAGDALVAALDALERERDEAVGALAAARADLAEARRDQMQAESDLVAVEADLAEALERGQNRTVDGTDVALAEAREALRRVIDINDRERMGDGTLSGFEWGEAINAARRLASEGGEGT